MASCAAHASTLAASMSGAARAISMFAAASAHRPPAMAARAIRRCSSAERAGGAPAASLASSFLPIWMAPGLPARGQWRHTSVRVSSTGQPRMRSPGPARALARSSVRSALASAPTARCAAAGLSAARLRPWRYRPPGQPGRPRAAHQAPGKPGWAASTTARRPGGQHGPLRREQPGQDRLMGERVPEPEGVLIGRDELQAHAVVAGRRARPLPAGPSAGLAAPIRTGGR